MTRLRCISIYKFTDCAAALDSFLKHTQWLFWHVIQKESTKIQLKCPDKRNYVYFLEQNMVLSALFLNAEGTMQESLQICC